MINRHILAPKIAYFSMEIELTSAMPTYSGGLGVLAGDLLCAAADLGIPIIGITLLNRKGYFQQHLDENGNQHESPVDWNPETYLKRLSYKASVTIEKRKVWIGVWSYNITGISGGDVTVYFLDTALPENSPWDQTLTDYLYGGDEHYRLCQEVVLGMGGLAMLRAMNYTDIDVYHMNEGHSALLTLALLREETTNTDLSNITRDNIEHVRNHCVFTTHTPVPAGIDKFSFSLVKQVIGENVMVALSKIDGLSDDVLNMNLLALFFSRYINGVSMRNEEVSRDMFPHYPVNSITNGVHALTWTSEPFRQLYDRYIPEWRHDNLYLHYVIDIPLDEIRQAHELAKQELLTEVNRRTGINFNRSKLTLGFARRMTEYKRPELLFANLERLKQIVRNVGPLQIIFSGKAHPRDEEGKVIIRHIFEAAKLLKDTIPIVYLENYDTTLAKYLCAGVDVWLNTPQKPFEASGTSGMKAALNGVPSLSILDGWWVEGHVEGVTGWSIGDPGLVSYPAREETSLYDKLENIIVPLYYHKPTEFNAIMRYSIALNASYFNTQRMMLQYLEHAYLS